MPVRSETKKVDYYRYGFDYDYKEPDVLPSEVAALMAREGVDKDYRFVWMGAAVIRVHGNTIDKTPAVKGDPRACVYRPMEVVLNGVPTMGLWLQPKDLCIRIAKPGYWYWTDDEGVRHTADREDQLVVPAGRLVARQDMLWDLGHLVWSLQYRITGQAGVEERLWSPADAPEEYWHTLKTFRNRDHGYLQPTVLDVESMILKREKQNRDLSRGQMREQIKHDLDSNRNYAAEVADAKEAADRAEWFGMVDEVVADVQRQTAYSGRAQRRA